MDSHARKPPATTNLSMAMISLLIPKIIRTNVKGVTKERRIKIEREDSALMIHTSQSLKIPNKSRKNT